VGIGGGGGIGGRMLVGPAGGRRDGEGDGEHERSAAHLPSLHRLHTSSNSSLPSFSRLDTILSPGLSQTRLSAGLPWITPSGVPVKMMSPGRSVRWREMKLTSCLVLKIRSLVFESWR